MRSRTCSFSSLISSSFLSRIMLSSHSVRLRRTCQSSYEQRSKVVQAIRPYIILPASRIEWLFTKLCTNVPHDSIWFYLKLPFNQILFLKFSTQWPQLIPLVVAVELSHTLNFCTSVHQNPTWFCRRLRFSCLSSSSSVASLSCLVFRLFTLPSSLLFSRRARSRKRCSIFAWTTIKSVRYR